jgi:hypothetical protein
MPYLSWRAWLFLATLRGMNSAEAYAHALQCGTCQIELARIAAGDSPTVPDPTLTMTEVVPAVAA